MESLAACVPLRLDEIERGYLRTLTGALNVSEYTDKVDTISWRYNKASRVKEQLEELLSTISGLLVVASYKRGKTAVHNKNFVDNQKIFQAVFEVGRRHKILNPDKMRTIYGKLMYILQDATFPETRRAMGFDFVAPIRTVRDELASLNALRLLEDPETTIAIRPLQRGETAEAKSNAFKNLVARYETPGDETTSARLELCLLSLGDVEALIDESRRPVLAMLQLLRTHFSRDAAPTDQLSSLAIRAGSRGARLTHSHSVQFSYVEQSLLLWDAIMSQLPRLWSLAEQDLLKGSDYRLRDTGQGYHRVQSAPSVGRFMAGELSKLQKRVGGWVGSAAVHLGDNDVPNALVWLDKYMQVPRILSPIISTLQEVDVLVKTAPGVTEYVSATFGSVEGCQKTILGDFFRHGFDGSGADNFYDAGSCIDGRLTSAWNWCSKLSKKSYFHVFKMAGFVGFDGSFSK